DIQGLAKVMDSNLVNPWGVSFIAGSPTGSPFWISDQRSDSTTLYQVTGPSGTDVKVNPNLPLVHIPTIDPTGPHGPTGQVSNTNSSSFHLTDPLTGDPVGDGNAARFIFANLDGTISAWNPSLGTTAFIEHTTQGAVFTGLAVNQAHTMLRACGADNGRPRRRGGGHFHRERQTRAAWSAARRPSRRSMGRRYRSGQFRPVQR